MREWLVNKSRRVSLKDPPGFKGTEPFLSLVSNLCSTGNAMKEIRTVPNEGAFGLWPTAIGWPLLISPRTWLSLSFPQMHAHCTFFSLYNIKIFLWFLHFDFSFYLILLFQNIILLLSFVFTLLSCEFTCVDIFVDTMSKCIDKSCLYCLFMQKNVDRDFS